MGKWSKNEYDRVLVSKIKDLFDSCNGFPEKPERDNRFTTFIRDLDISDKRVQACFRTLLQTHHRGPLRARQNPLRRRIITAEDPEAIYPWDLHYRDEGIDDNGLPRSPTPMPFTVPTSPRIGNNNDGDGEGEGEGRTEIFEFAPYNPSTGGGLPLYRPGDLDRIMRGEMSLGQQPSTSSSTTNANGNANAGPIFSPPFRPTRMEEVADQLNADAALSDSQAWLEEYRRNRDRDNAPPTSSRLRTVSSNRTLSSHRFNSIPDFGSLPTTTSFRSVHERERIRRDGDVGPSRASLPPLVRRRGRAEMEEDELDVLDQPEGPLRSRIRLAYEDYPAATTGPGILNQHEGGWDSSAEPLTIPRLPRDTRRDGIVFEADEVDEENEDGAATPRPLLPRDSPVRSSSRSPDWYGRMRPEYMEGWATDNDVSERDRIVREEDGFGNQDETNQS